MDFPRALFHILAAGVVALVIDANASGSSPTRKRPCPLVSGSLEVVDGDCISFVSDGHAPQSLADRINKIVLPQVDFQNMTLRDAFDFVQQETGINIVFKAEEEIKNRTVSLRLKNVGAMEVLQYLAHLACGKCHIDPNAFMIVPVDTPTQELVVKEYRIPRTVMTGTSAKDYLEAQNVQFPPGSSAVYVPTFEHLIVRNTPDNIDLIDDTVESLPEASEIKRRPLAPSQNLKGEQAIQSPRQRLNAGLTAVEFQRIHDSEYKLERAIIPKVEFHKADLRQVIDFLNRNCGVPVVMELDGGAEAKSRDESSVTLSLRDIPAQELLKYVALLTGVKPLIEPGVVMVMPRSCSDERFYQIEYYQVPCEVFGKSAKEYLQNLGIPFPKGSWVKYSSASSESQLGDLAVINTEENLDYIRLVIGELANSAETKQGTDEEIRTARRQRSVRTMKCQLEKLFIPTVEWHDLPVSEAIEFVRSKVPVPIGMQLDPGKRINLSLTNVSAMVLLRQIALQANAEAVVGRFAIALVPLAGFNGLLASKEFEVPPGFLCTIFCMSGQRGMPLNQSVKALLEDQGISFPSGASVKITPGSNRMVVRNTQEAMDQLELLIATFMATPADSIPGADFTQD